MARSSNRSAGASGRTEDSIPIADLLREAGFETPSARTHARAVLEAAGLTRAGKQGIARYKRDAALAELDRRLVAVCGRECAALAALGREAVITSGRTCEVCGGSNNRRAALAARRALANAGVRRVLIVGGSAQQQHELGALLASSRLQVDFVDGTRSHTQKEAIANMNRVQLMVIWGSTPLKHAVSRVYMAERPPGMRSIGIAKRGIEALCLEIVRSYAR